ncbi:hypothetical protein [Kingella negevensis]|uniref:hypothetical protein n=1 Tax=Kingella negevensis TaxID=1522312 RepID=UPI00254BEECF|nr:hypothetical protein [Kingella negevensis]MDK4689687.1 hypothetical protein [Kingella negevensis]
MNQTLLYTLITRQIDWLRYEKTLRADVFALLDNMQSDIGAKLFSGSLNTQLHHVETVLQNGFDVLMKTLDVLPMLQTETAWLLGTMTAIAAAYGVKDKLLPLAKQKIAELADKFTVGGLTLPETLAKQRDNLILRLKALVRSAKIDDVLPSMDDIADTFKRAKQTAQTMTKTWINSVKHTAHEAFGKINPFVKGFRHISVLDSGTTAACTHRNGLLWDKKHNPIGHTEIFKRPPLHYNCRSKLVYVYDIKEKFNGFSGDDWVKSRSLNELQDQFGKGVGQMLFDGSLKLSAALDGLRTMSLKELRKQYTLSIFSENFEQRFTQLQKDVVQAKLNKMKVETARKSLALDKVWEISHIDRQVQTWLGASTNKVWLSEDTLIKQLFNHGELGIEVYRRIPNILTAADLILRVDDLKIAFLIDGEEMYKLVLKTTQERDELYFVSLFKMKTKEWERSKEKGEILFEKKTGG